MSHENQTASFERAVTPGRVAAPRDWIGSRRERLFHAVLEKLANAIVQKSSPEALRFGLVCEPAQLAAVGRMRRRVYQARLPYLLKELAADGTDAHDAHSFVFAAWREEEVVGTIRLTRFPYETLQYVPEAQLSRWLGEDWDTDYVEWGRLLVDSAAGLSRLAPALVTYAGLYVYGLTSYSKNFGYVRGKPRDSFARFQHEYSSFTFQIPHRGDHSYSLVKSEFLKTSVLAAPRWMRSVAKQALLSVSNPSRDRADRAA